VTITDQITQTAQAEGVDPALALEVAIAESNLNPNAVSPAGAIGVFQLMPATATALGVDPRNVTQNIQGGIAYLKQMLDQFGGDVSAALAAYNWGPGNVASAIASYASNWLQAAPAETQSYVSKILNALGQYTVSIQPSQIIQSAAQAVGVTDPAVAAIGIGLLIFFGVFLLLD
jgi:soluble lytic murein transglycosylase-like protein